MVNEDEVRKADHFVTNLLENGTRIECETSGKCLELPDWFDLQLYRRGQAFYHKHIFAMYFAKLLGLMSILAIDSIRSVLELTRQSNTPEKSFRRYVATILHMHTWYASDICDRQSPLWRSIRRVRQMHASASRRHAPKSGPISQTDMALTQFGFLAFQLVRPQTIGIHELPAAEPDFYAFTHFWRTIGHLLGINDKFNLCRNNLHETQAICNLLIAKLFRPEIQNNRPEFRRMLNALIDGMWSFNPLLNPPVFYRLLCDLCDIKHHEKPTNQNSWLHAQWQSFTYHFIRFVQQILLRFEPFRIYFNAQKYLSLFLIEYFPFLAFHRFGYANSFVSIFGSEVITNPAFIFFKFSDEIQCASKY